MIQTSSPSFVLMQSMDDARAWMDAHGSIACDRLLAAMENFRVKAAALGFADDQAPYPSDRLRLILRAPQGGEQLRGKLQEAGIDVETSDTDHIVCIVSLLDGEARLAALLSGLEHIAGVGLDATPPRLRMYPSVWPERRMALSDAAFADSGTSCAGRTQPDAISAAHVGIYPPGDRVADRGGPDYRRNCGHDPHNAAAPPVWRGRRHTVREIRRSQCNICPMTRYSSIWTER